jgi:hypothetical protein
LPIVDVGADDVGAVAGVVVAVASAGVLASAFAVVSVLPVSFAGGVLAVVGVSALGAERLQPDITLAPISTAAAIEPVISVLESMEFLRVVVRHRPIATATGRWRVAQ